MTDDHIRIKEDNRPLYLVAVEILEDFIEEKYSPGDKLPSEGELGELLGISRSTLRVTLGILEQKGLIHRNRGVGTFVSPARAHMVSGGLQYMQSIQSLAKKVNFSAKTSDFKVKPVKATQELARLMDVEIGADLTNINYKVLLDDLPVISLDKYMQNELVDLENLDPDDYIYADPILDNESCSLCYTHSNIYAINADKKIAKELLVEEGSALLHLLETFYSDYDNVIAVAYNHLVTDRFNFYIGRTVRK